MLHRHLENSYGDLSLAAIDDIVERGSIEDWISLAAAAKADPARRSAISELVRATIATSERRDRPSFWLGFCDHLSVSDGILER